MSISFDMAPSGLTLTYPWNGIPTQRASAYNLETGQTFAPSRAFALSRQ
jgi:hypothetical protein